MRKALEDFVRIHPTRSRDDLDEDGVRKLLVEQHGRLRVLMSALDEKAATVVCTCRPEPDMRAELEKVLQSLTDHICDEERALVTLLPRTQDSGRSLRLLREDHALQLEELDSMRRCAARSDDAITLALAIRAFVADVQLEMDLEDRRYLSVDGARDVQA
ncbi:MAG TPA: hypothetical protein VK989_16155 [Polyangia bacterium]|jgi:hypothetical protein|nr:hypothetical protein [Polyangia bacterium]